MTVHLIKGGGAVVTGTKDPREAARQLGLGHNARGDEDVPKWLNEHYVIEYGRVVPAETDDALEGSELFWRWVPASHFGEPGVTPAVVWRAE